MRQIFRKLRILATLLASAYDNWRTEIWKRDLDETFCCNGRECGCYGASVGQIYGEKQRP